MITCVATPAKPQEHGLECAAQECPRISAVCEEFESISVDVNDLWNVCEVYRYLFGTLFYVKVIVICEGGADLEVFNTESLFLIMEFYLNICIELGLSIVQVGKSCGDVDRVEAVSTHILE